MIKPSKMWMKITMIAEERKMDFFAFFHMSKLMSETTSN